MRLESLKYLYDVSQAAEALAEFCAGETGDHFLESVLLRSAVERQIGIAGNALALLGRIDPETFSQVPAAAQIVAIADTLKVDYANDNARLVWKMVSENLAALRAWLVEHENIRWDQQLEADSKAGKLDAIIAESLADCKKFEEIEYQSHVLKKVRRGDERAAVEGSLTHEQVKQRLGKWLDS